MHCTTVDYAMRHMLDPSLVGTFQTSNISTRTAPLLRSIRHRDGSITPDDVVHQRLSSNLIYPHCLGYVHGLGLAPCVSRGTLRAGLGRTLRVMPQTGNHGKPW